MAGSDLVWLDLAVAPWQIFHDAVFSTQFFLRITRMLQVLAFQADGSRFYAHVVIAVSPRVGGVLAGPSLQLTVAELGSFGRGGRRGARFFSAL